MTHIEQTLILELIDSNNTVKYHVQIRPTHPLCSEWIFGRSSNSNVKTIDCVTLSYTLLIICLDRFANLLTHKHFLLSEHICVNTKHLNPSEQRDSAGRHDWRLSLAVDYA